MRVRMCANAPLKWNSSSVCVSSCAHAYVPMHDLGRTVDVSGVAISRARLKDCI